MQGPSLQITYVSGVRCLTPGSICTVSASKHHLMPVPGLKPLRQGRVTGATCRGISGTGQQPGGEAMQSQCPVSPGWRSSTGPHVAKMADLHCTASQQQSAMWGVRKLPQKAHQSFRQVGMLPRGQISQEYWGLTPKTGCMPRSSGVVRLLHSASRPRPRKHLF